MSILTTIADINFNIRNEAVKQGLPYAEDVAADHINHGGQVLTDLINGWLRVAIVIGAVILLFNLIWGGLTWIMSGGDKGNIEKARNRITHSIIGILVLASSVAIFIAINHLLGNPINVVTLSDGGGDWGGGGGGVIAACKCGRHPSWGEDRYAPLGTIGSLTGELNNCYVCTKSGWQHTDDKTCGVITNCAPL